MSFFQTYALAAGTIALAGAFFFWLGWSKLSGLHAKGLPWKVVMRHAVRGTGESAREGLYFCVFGGFIVVFAAFAVGSLALVQLLVPSSHLR